MHMVTAAPGCCMGHRRQRHRLTVHHPAVTGSRDRNADHRKSPGARPLIFSTPSRVLWLGTADFFSMLLSPDAQTDRQAVRLLHDLSSTNDPRGRKRTAGNYTGIIRAFLALVQSEPVQ